MMKDSPSKKPAWDFHPAVFLSSAIIIILAVVIGLIYIGQNSAEQAEQLFSSLKTAMSNATGWFFILSVNIFLILVLYIGFSKYGNIRIGGKEAQPEFSRLSWFAMLFSAGMGIGLVFWSVAEPISHYSSPPVAEAETALAAREAMTYTFFHWGFHAWGIYALVGLAVAYACFNLKQPLTIRSTFYPLLGDKVHGPLGNLIDILAVVATLFGVATSLGLGVQQVNAGLNHLWNVEEGVNTQILLILGITGIATISVVSGVNNGIRKLSTLNMVMAALLLLSVLVFGPSLFLLDALVQNIGDYAQKLPALSTWTEAYTDAEWQNGWTIFYWAWWIAWSPFVGMFIARISKGRTVREFVTCVLLVPSLLGILWLGIFGNAALHQELLAEGGVATAVHDNNAVAIFALLENYSMAGMTSGLAILVVVTFFITSSDSGSLVIDIITAGGKTDPPVKQRIFWAVLEGLVAAVLLIGGGLLALQTASILSGLPFAIVLLFMGWSLLKALRTEN